MNEHLNQDKFNSAKKQARSLDKDLHEPDLQRSILVFVQLDG
ncbi:hypothetical protein [Legionella jordanis]|nr:hypothetical protein [Legionella jordanis]